MSLKLRWLGSSEQELDLVAGTRMRGYAHAARDLDRYKEGIRSDPRSAAGDFLLAEQDGIAVGTATSLSMTMWMRGSAIPCQGVAYVGTIKTHRRGSASGAAGIATRVMHEMLRIARERGQVVSALMPFRASFYEHFGYGLVERRYDWMLPLSVLPVGDFQGIRFYEPGDMPELRLCRQRIAQAGQCDIERTEAMWELTIKKAEDGFFVVDRPASGGPIHGWAYLRHAIESGKELLRVMEIGYENAPALVRLLRFLGSLRDQYSTAAITLPLDVQVNRLLRESQLPHRPVYHPTADGRAQTRMQLRVLDHARLLESLHLPTHFKGAAMISIKESDEGHSRPAQVSRFRLEIGDGRAQVKSAAAGAPAPRLECADTTWASVVTGDLSASAATRLGLAEADPAAAVLLDAFAQGPAPACLEYF